MGDVLYTAPARWTGLKHRASVWRFGENFDGFLLAWLLSTKALTYLTVAMLYDDMDMCIHS
jgi:hypothetical protein